VIGTSQSIAMPSRMSVFVALIVRLLCCSLLLYDACLLLASRRGRA